MLIGIGGLVLSVIFTNSVLYPECKKAELESGIQECNTGRSSHALISTAPINSQREPESQDENLTAEARNKNYGALGLKYPP